jgi:hypothetical protein
MKHVKLFENYLNEAVKFNVEVEEPFVTKNEKKASAQFKIVTQPITIVDVNGEILEDSTDVEISFSNGDKAEFEWLQNFGKSSTMVITPNGGTAVDISNKIDDYLGSTGTVIGDISLMYKYWKLGKLK